MRVFIFSLLIIGTFQCHDDDSNITRNVCTTTGSHEDIKWFAELKSSMECAYCETSIIQGTYAGQDVIFAALTDPLCDGIDTPTLYTCDGIELRSFSTSLIDQQDLRENLTRDTVLYRCKP
jgi:hypothetical protein